MKKTGHKAPYEPPRIRRVRLMGDEMAVTGCKAIMVGPNLCRRGAVFIVRQQGS